MKHLLCFTWITALLALTGLFPAACDDGGDESVCGDGQRQSGEECDGADLAGATCVGQGFDSGELACAAGCTFDTAGCSNVVCGDGRVDDGEDCEPGLALVETCAELGFEAGTPACAADCTFDTAGCRVPLTCGDGDVHGWEDCEANDPAGETCETLGFDSGSLTCTDACLLDTAGCVSVSLCGNGTVDAGEFCDGAVPAGKTCEGIGFPEGGTLACADDCTLDVSGCDPTCHGTPWGYECDPATTVCCAEEGRAVGCVRLGTWGNFCWTICEEPYECGLNVECMHLAGNDTGFCFSTPACNSEYLPCTASDGSLALCVPAGMALEQGNMCGVSGHRRQGQSCDPLILAGELVYDLNDLCHEGQCVSDPAAPAAGSCLNFCDVKRIFAGTLEDTCPDHTNCLNQSGIIMDDDAYQRGYRTADYGLCYPTAAGVDPVITSPHVACHLLTGIQTRSGLPCADGAACLPFRDGNLQGVCRPVSATPKAPGDACDPAAELSECDADSACVVSDPFRDDTTMACRRFCDATIPEDNDRCADLAGGPFVCLTTSRFYTYDHALPTSYGTDTQPSPLGFCVPPQ